MVTKTKPAKRKSRNSVRGIAASRVTSFQAGAIVLVTLNNPREKFWGMMLGLDAAGVSLRGIELSSFEDATNAVIAGEPISSVALFFPMHRVERIELDLPEGNIPSMSQRFASRTG
ncbi:MAG TPA: hypothetical protein VFI95_20395, partial [Terriglobales bacterium]|nr:hypothetical protein [Terriglobales bacterium]